MIQLILVSVIGNPCWAKEGSTGSLLFKDIQDIAGDYLGEVREQSSDGHLDRLMVPKVRVSLALSGDELILHVPAHWIGMHCESGVGGIRELIRFPLGHPPVLKAEFDFTAKGCSSKGSYDAVLVVLDRDSHGELTLETLLVRPEKELEQHPEKITNIHGYFTKIESPVFNGKQQETAEKELKLVDKLSFRQ